MDMNLKQLNRAVSLLNNGIPKRAGKYIAIVSPESVSNIRKLIKSRPELGLKLRCLK